MSTTEAVLEHHLQAIAAMRECQGQAVGFF